MGIESFFLGGGVVVFDLEGFGVGSRELGAFSATARSHPRLFTPSTLTASRHFPSTKTDVCNRLDCLS